MSIYVFTCVSTCIWEHAYASVHIGWRPEFGVWCLPTTFFYVAGTGMVFYVDSGDVKVTIHTHAASFYILSHLPSRELIHYYNGRMQDEIGVCILPKWLKTLRVFTVLTLEESLIIKFLLPQHCQDEVNAFIIVPPPWHQLTLFHSYPSSLLSSHHKAMPGHTVCCPHHPCCTFLLSLSDGVFYWKSLNFILFFTLISTHTAANYFFILSRHSNIP